MDIITKETLQKWLPAIQEELSKVVKFWMQHSLDETHGGFFTCLDANGKVFDETKYVWLQSRQVWMLMRLFIEVDRFKDQSLADAAIKGAEFLLANCRVVRGSSTRCVFSMKRDGKAIKIQRTLFSECFFVMAMSECWRGVKEIKYKEAAVLMMQQIEKWCLVDDTDLGREKLPGCEPQSSLAVPMMGLRLCHQMSKCGINWSENKNLELWAVKEIWKHVQRNGERILENVSPNGEELPGSAGRLQIPGHAIECGWFLLDYYRQNDEKKLASKAIEKFIESPFEQGWDSKHGGLLYFIDADNFPPTQLEWNMKLWWPHNEAMIAFLMAYQHDGESKHIEAFHKVACYAFEKFSDNQHGEWFGYLSQQGVVSSQFKGGPWKGCFHVPRCLYLCEKIIKNLLKC